MNWQKINDEAQEWATILAPMATALGMAWINRRERDGPPPPPPDRTEDGE